VGAPADRIGERLIARILGTLRQWWWQRGVWLRV
jgi:hypothetical protein